jgi:hypothetical protein
LSANQIAIMKKRNLNSKCAIWLAVLLAVFAALLYNLPYFIKGADLPLRIHENLEQRPISDKKIYQESNPYWYTGASERVLDGNYFQAKGPRLQYQTIAYFYLDAFNAFLITDIVSRIVAFLGMFMFLTKLLGAKNNNILVKLAASTLFAWLPFLTPLITTVMISPLIAWLFFVFYDREQKWYHWLALSVIPFFTSYLMVPVFILIIVIILYLIELLIKRKINLSFITAWVVMNVLYIITQYPLVFQILYNQEPSHRVLRHEKRISLGAAISESISNFLSGHHHVPTLHSSRLLWLFLIGVIFIVVIFLRNQLISVIKESRPQLKWLGLTIFLTGAISLYYGLFSWTPFKDFYESSVLLRMLNTKRFHWLHPMLWYTTFALIMYFLYNTLKQKRKILAWMFIIVFFLLQARVLINGSEWNRMQRDKNYPTFEQFYAAGLFSQINEHIGKPNADYRVVSLAMPPAIALYNGFYCLDAYRSNYFLSYHQEFREIIAPSLENNPGQKKYFDTRGNRCYLMDDELSISYIMWHHYRRTVTSINELNINYDKLYEMGGRYIFSAVEILNTGESIVLLEVFEDLPEKSHWKVYLYEVLP